MRKNSEVSLMIIFRACLNNLLPSYPHRVLP